MATIPQVEYIMSGWASLPYYTVGAATILARD